MELYPYQREGVDFLKANRRAYLADEMGLGKTVQAIVAARELFDSTLTSSMRTLVVCPASVQENWKREWETWGGPGDLTVISYSKLIRNPNPGRYDLVLLDEAHYCRTPGAKRTKAALRLAAAAPRTWLLSGTPVVNDPRELWPAAKALWPELPKRYGIHNAFEWMHRWCVWSTSDYGYRVHGLTDAAKTELVPELKKIMLRRRLNEIALELPPLRTTVQYLPKDDQLSAELEALTVEGDDVEYMSTLRRILGQYKAPKIADEINREMKDGQYSSILVLYHHRATGNLLRERLGGLLFGFDGSTPAKDRQGHIDGFQKLGGIFLAQQTAAGIGINLTRATEVILVEPSWSPSDNFQAIKRAHRLGQESPVRARLFAVPDSLDDALMGTLLRKSKMIKELVG